MTSTIMPEVEIDETAPGEIVLVRQEDNKQDVPNPLIFFIVFLPFVFLGAVTIISATKLLQWGIKKSSENKTNAPVAAAYSQMDQL